MKAIIYLLIYTPFKLLSFLPLGVLYRLADFAAFLGFYVVKYRKKVVLKNLHNAFPQKSAAEIRTITKGFYKHFTDVLVESIKLISVSDRGLIKGMVIKNPELLDKYYSQNRSVILYGGHYCNWEWGIVLSKTIKFKMLCVYQPLLNPYFDQLIRSSRSRFNCELIRVQNIHRRMIEHHNMKSLTFSVIADDQSPKSKSYIWTQLFNLDTAFGDGVEKIARKTNHVVLFAHLKRIKRGRYEMTFIPITEDAANTKEGEITRKFAELMEAMITAEPRNWLWSHKRWKIRKD